MSESSSEYIVSTICIGNKYEPIKQHWVKRIKEKCKKIKDITIIDETNIKVSDIPSYEYAWWDVVRLKHNVELCINENIPVIHVDIDIIIEKDIEEIVHLPYDIIISKEIGGEQAFPKECSKILGFGVCSGFYIIKKEATSFMIKMLTNMRKKVYNSLSDQVNIMNYIVNNKYLVKEEECVLNNVTYNNKIIEIHNIKICVLDFDIITRDPILTKNQFGNHINIDNVGGVSNFINYFYKPLEQLPLTCRCGKKELGDNNVCTHLR